jgi:hypothetical protein
MSGLIGGTAYMSLLKAHEPCPVCLLTFEERGKVPIDSMMNHDFGYGCAHYVCMDCLYKLAEMRHMTCPVCRGDIKPLLESLFEWETDDDDDESEYDESEYFDSCDVCAEEWSNCVCVCDCGELYRECRTACN